ncbi:hypothetical protein [Crucian carp herpesvirus]|uniref:ORF104 n=1 Tax=Cyprinid herpesvirus 2 TaxID=317878 RepID=A0A120HV92_CYHV2|nr:ORF104 [Cyprinid herpesvirus 2]APD51582.1 hypothetical protein [Crucian carp herpesvirus]QAU54826.1 protein ORF104 [Cyprinid herpesvirus 2]QIM55274.1 hypothetical protein [Cyprinid herpesvirus 2]
MTLLDALDLCVKQLVDAMGEETVFSPPLVQQSLTPPGLTRLLSTETPLEVIPSIRARTPRPLRLQSCLHLRNEVRISSSKCGLIISEIKPQSPWKLTRTPISNHAASNTCRAASPAIQVVDLISPSPSGDSGMSSATKSLTALSTPSTVIRRTSRLSSTSPTIIKRKRKRSASPKTGRTPILSSSSCTPSDETMSEDCSFGTKSRRLSPDTCSRISSNDGRRIKRRPGVGRRRPDTIKRTLNSVEAEAALRREAVFLRTLTVQEAFSPQLLTELTRIFSSAAPRRHQDTFILSSSQLMSYSDDDKPTANVLVARIPSGLKNTKYDLQKALGSGRYSKVCPVVKRCKRATPPFATECVKLCTNVNDWLAPLMLNHPNLMPGTCIYSESRFCIKMPRLTMSMHDLAFGLSGGRFGLPMAKEEKSVMMSEIILGVLKAVEYMGSMSLYHNDIKPANVMVSPNPFQVKLSDFSLTTYMPQPGTAYFSAPEVATSNGNSSPLANADIFHSIAPYVSDVWSIACLAYGASRREKDLNTLLKFEPCPYYESPDSTKRYFNPNWRPLPKTVAMISFSAEDKLCERVFRLGTLHFTERPTAGKLLDMLVKEDLLTARRRKNVHRIERTSCFVNRTFSF